MINAKGLFFIAIVLSLLISGCVSQQPSQVTPTPTRALPTQVPTPTATPVVTPVITPPVTPGTSVVVLTAPATAIAGRSFEITWRVNSPTAVNITHTAVHYGPQSESEPLTLQSYPSLTTPQGGTIPANFSANLTINTTGTTYFRAHAIVNSTFYWSPEMTMFINASSTSATPTAKITPTPTPTISVGGSSSY